MYQHAAFERGELVRDTIIEAAKPEMVAAFVATAASMPRPNIVMFLVSQSLKMVGIANVKLVLMSNSSPVHCRTIEDVPLLYPASKLIITQRFQASRESPFWAWIIVGAFYDRQDNVLWSTEIFAGRLDIDSDSEDESIDTESLAESYTEETASSGKH
ncbi:hypothetical protein FVER53590_11612 [Fusarium verticillioides]|nr:hypothetical protein FVER53590_11612 [Fusarium verticillioides]